MFSNYKISKNNKLGFTVVEITVVMSIIAILSVITVSAFIGVRRQYVIDDAVENLLSEIRESQNKAISVIPGCGGACDTKVWGIGNFTSYSYELLSLYPSVEDATKLQASTENRTEVSSDVTIRVFFSGTELDLNTDSGFIAYSSPFGTSYVSKKVFQDGEDALCFWQTNANRVAKDFFLDNTACGSNFIAANHNPSGDIEIRFNYNDSNVIKSVFVKSDGDAYVQ